MSENSGHQRTHPGRCTGCGGRIPPYAIMPRVGGGHVHPVTKPEPKMCGPVITVWSYHVAMAIHVNGNLVAMRSEVLVSEFPIENAQDLRRFEAHYGRALEVSAVDVKSGAAILGGHTDVQLVSMTMIAME